MTLDTDPTNALTYDVSLNDRPYTTHRLVEVPKKPGELPPDWLAAVQDCVWIRKHDLGTIGEGPHTLKFRAGAQNVILEKLVVETSGLRESYLGPPREQIYCMLGVARSVQGIDWDLIVVCRERIR